jgi:hypothetical protein
MNHLYGYYDEFVAEFGKNTKLHFARNDAGQTVALSLFSRFCLLPG